MSAGTSEELKSILYVEDNAAEGEITTRLYQTVRSKFHGEVQFSVVPTWDLATEFVKCSRPGVVIADLSLAPLQTGEMTIELIRQVAMEWPPILVLTGNDYDLDLRRKCILAGAQDFMIKADARHGCMELLAERAYHCFLRGLYAAQRT